MPSMINLDGIKNIIFDFGGVIINIDHSLPGKKFMELGIKNFDKLYSQALQNHLFDKLERGEITPGEFRNDLRKYIPITVSDNEIDDAWNSIILDIPPERIKILEKLQNNYQTFLLSNTNEIHYDCYRANLEKVYGYKNFDELFKKAYFSFEMGMQKPYPEIYETVLSENNLIANETLFIDDTLKHVEGAARVGIRAFHLEKGVEIARLFAH